MSPWVKRFSSILWGNKIIWKRFLYRRLYHTLCFYSIQNSISIQYFHCINTITLLKQTTSMLLNILQIHHYFSPQSVTSMKRGNSLIPAFTPGLEYHCSLSTFCHFYLCLLMKWLHIVWGGGKKQSWKTQHQAKYSSCQLRWVAVTLEGCKSSGQFCSMKKCKEIIAHNKKNI